MPDPSETGVLAQVAAICDALRDEGCDALALPLRDVPSLVQSLEIARPDVVFNCCESFRGRAELEPAVAGLFELLRLPYTGSPPLTLGLALNKARTKAMFRAAQVPTASSCVVDSAAAMDAASDLHWPLIVKPVAEDASLGIDAGAVVHDRQHLERRVDMLVAAFGAPVLVEEYVDGREFMVALLATAADRWRVLPIEEVTFDGYPADHPRILTYDAKWAPSSVAYRGSAVAWPAMEPALRERLEAAALAAAGAVGLRDYGRVDVRVDRAGRVHVLEVNPNPDIGPDSGFAATVGAAGVTYRDAVRAIVERALERRAVAGGW